MIPYTGTLASLVIVPVSLSLLVRSSRQRYVLGDSAMHAMASADVFISGMGGLGVEIGESATPTGLYDACVSSS